MPDKVRFPTIQVPSELFIHPPSRPAQSYTLLDITNKCVPSTRLLDQAYTDSTPVVFLPSLPDRGRSTSALTLTDSDRNTRKDIALPEGKIGDNIREEFSNGKDLM